MFIKLRTYIYSFFKSESNNKKLSTYLLFLFISFSFWFLSMLSKYHETSIRVPLRYINFPTGKSLVSIPSSFIDVRVKAPGFSILYHNLFNSSELFLDVEQANIKPKENSIEFFWLMSSQRNTLSNIFSSSIELLVINPERITLLFNNKSEKKVPVILNQSISLEPQKWFSSDILLLPDSVTIYGTQEEIDTIHCIQTEKLVLLNLSKSVKSHILLEIPRNIDCNISSVETRINIESFVEQTQKYKIEARNLRDGYAIKLFPEEVQVTLRASKDKYNMLKTSFLILEVNADLALEGFDRLDVEVSNLPSFIHLERIYPSSVEFLLIKE